MANLYQNYYKTILPWLHQRSSKRVGNLRIYSPYFPRSALSPSLCGWHSVAKSSAKNLIHWHQLALVKLCTCYCHDNPAKVHYYGTEKSMENSAKGLHVKRFKNCLTTRSSRLNVCILSLILCEDSVTTDHTMIMIIPALLLFGIWDPVCAACSWLI